MRALAWLREHALDVFAAVGVFFAQVAMFKFFMPIMVSQVSIALGVPDPHVQVGWGQAVGMTVLLLVVGVVFFALFFAFPSALGGLAWRAARRLGKDGGAWGLAGERVGRAVVLVAMIALAWWR